MIYLSFKSFTMSPKSFRKCQFMVQKNFKRKLKRKTNIKYKIFYYILCVFQNTNSTVANGYKPISESVYKFY